MTSPLLSLALIGLAAAAPTAAQTPPKTAVDAQVPSQTAQEPAAVLFRDVGYRGPSITVKGSRPDLDLPWPVRSIWIRAGVWELCQRADFHGRCTRYDASDGSIPSARAYTQSARPVDGRPD